MSNDYDQALYYMYHCKWNDLLVLMVNTSDDIFSKKIEHFLHAFKYERNLKIVDERLNELFQYIDHATDHLQLHDDAFNLYTASIT